MRIVIELRRVWQFIRLFWLVNCYSLLRHFGNLIDYREGVIEQRVAQLMGRRILRVLRMKAEVEGAEKLLGVEHYCVVSNHVSYLDWVLILAVFPSPVSFIAKNELRFAPFLGTYLRNRGLLIDRKRGLSARNQIKQMADENPWPIVIFPEGTRSPDGEPKKFRRAGIRILADQGRVLVPITLLGTYEALGRNARVIERGRQLRVVISDPIDPKKVGSEEAVRQAETVIKEVYEQRHDEFRPAHARSEAEGTLRAV